jgi:hypothetical protein
MTGSIDEKLAQMDEVIAQQIADANAEVNRLGDRYIQEFWETAKDIFGPITY